MSPAPLPLSDPQAAALAKLGCGLEAGGGVVVLCGPAGVGKTTVLDRLVTELRAAGRAVTRRWATVSPAPTTEPAGVVIIEDAHLATVAELAELAALCGRQPGVAVVLAGEGRLLTLMARDPRLGRAARIRATLLPGGLEDTRAILTARATGHGAALAEPVVAAIHEIAGGVPADVIRLAELAEIVAAGRADGRLTPCDIEAIHRRLCPQAA